MEFREKLVAVPNYGKVTETVKEDKKSGIISRKLVFRNTQSGPSGLRAVLRVSVSPGEYDLYRVNGRGKRESGGMGQSFPVNLWVLTCEGGRTIQGNAPIAGLREKDGKNGWVIHILPKAIGLFIIAKKGSSLRCRRIIRSQP